MVGINVNCIALTNVFLPSDQQQGQTIRTVFAYISRLSYPYYNFMDILQFLSDLVSYFINYAFQKIKLLDSLANSFDALGVVVTHFRLDDFLGYLFGVVQILMYLPLTLSAKFAESREAVHQLLAVLSIKATEKHYEMSNDRSYGKNMDAKSTIKETQGQEGKKSTSVRAPKRDDLKLSRSSSDRRSKQTLLSDYIQAGSIRRTSSAGPGLHGLKYSERKVCTDITNENRNTRWPRN